MIKNNFIITESEKERILNMVRLPNHRKPIRLDEQGKVKISWDDEEKSPVDLGGSKTSSDELKEKLLKLGITEDFNNVKYVEDLTNTIIELIKKPSRSLIYRIFYDALGLAIKVYKKEEYKTYQTSIENAVIQSKTLVSDIPDWNFYTNPSDFENYDKKNIPNMGNRSYFVYKALNPTEYIEKMDLRSEDCENLFEIMVQDTFYTLPQVQQNQTINQVISCYGDFYDPKLKRNFFGKYKETHKNSVLKKLTNKQKENLKNLVAKYPNNAALKKLVEETMGLKTTASVTSGSSGGNGSSGSSGGNGSSGSSGGNGSSGSSGATAQNSAISPSYSFDIRKKD